MQTGVLIISGAVLAIVVLGLALGAYFSTSNEASQSPSLSPSPFSSPSLTATPSYWKRAFPIVETVNKGWVEGKYITRESSISINYELQNRVDNQSQVTLSVDTNGVDFANPPSPLDYFNITYSTPTTMILQPLENKTVTLTIAAKDNALCENYNLVAEFQSLDFDGNPYFYGSVLAFTVVPKSIPSESNFYLGNSRIFVVSANASYGTYPYPTVTSMPHPSPSVIAKNGESCVIINVTLRNDYSTQDPPPNKPAFHNASTVYVALTAKIFEGENQIDSRDITNAADIGSVFVNRAFTSFSYGETDTVTIYLATDNAAVTSFQLVPYYVGSFPPP